MAIYRTYGSSTNRVTYPITHWVTWKGEGTVTIRASGNVTSITDYGTCLLYTSPSPRDRG